MSLNNVEDAVTELFRLDDLKQKIWDIEEDIEDGDKRAALSSCVRLIEKEKERIEGMKIREELNNE